MLKEVYGRNMIEAMWNEIMNDKNEFIDIKSGQKTSAKGLRKYTFPSSITIPVYDSLGNIMGTKNYNEPLSPYLFQQIEITQNWFYNYSKNIVINNIPDITLFLRSKNFQDYEENETNTENYIQINNLFYFYTCDCSKGFVLF
jgi:hypothetical protein